MGILSKILTLPVRGPADGVLWIAGQIAKQAEAERNSPVALRAALSAAEQALLEGQITEDEYEVIEDDLLARLSAAAVR